MGPSPGFARLLGPDLLFPAAEPRRRVWDPSRGGWESAIAALADEPGTDELLRPDALLLVWSLDGASLLWTSRTDEAVDRVKAKLTSLGFLAADRLRAIARAGSAHLGVQRERWRPAGGDGAASPVTVACRVIRTEAGQPGLLTVLPGDLPARAERFGARSPGGSPLGRDLSASPSSGGPTDSRGPGPPKGVRFTWRTDAEGRFADVPEALATSVGATASDIAGLRWSDLVGPLVIDPDGTVARHLASRTAWTRAEILWRDIGRNRAVPVEISGAPVAAADGSFAGFRGFAQAFPADAGSAAGVFGALSGLHARRDAGPHAPKSLAGLGEAMGAAAALTGTAAALTGTAAALTGSAGDTVFEMLRAMFGGRADVAASAGRELDRHQTVEPALSPVPAPPSPGDRPAGLSAAENGALHEIARALGASTAPEASSADTRASAEIVPLPPRPRIPEAARILDRLPLAVTVLREGVPVFANRALLDLAGARDVPSWVATGGLATLFGRDLDLASVSTATLKSSGRPDLDVTVNPAEITWGEAAATLVALLPSPDGRTARELKSAHVEHEAGRRRAAELQASLELAADGVVTIDLSGRILSLSRAAEALFGYTANELAGDVVTVLIAPQDHRSMLEAVEAASRAPPGTATECEVRDRARGGRARPLSVRVGVVAGAAGPIYLLAFRDISAFKTLEAELREARGRAEQTGANRADFLARVSHEIRTPLTAITGFAELMLQERSGPLGSERYKGYVRDIQASGGHVISLVNDLLDLAKASSGGSDLTPANLDLNEIVRQCVASCMPLAARERTILRTSFDRAVPPVRADERSVRQIVWNLMSNAIRYTGAGGQVIVSTTSPKPGDVRLCVRDTGPGMSADEIGAALTPFRQVPATRRGGGTGLGLPLSKALVEANGGVFTITSSPGRGTLIAIHLPEADPSEEAATSE